MAAGAVEVNVTTNNFRPCAVFDGVDDYVEVAHNANQLGANLANGFTISAWIMPRSTGENNGGRILDKSTGNNGNGGFRFDMYTGPTVYFTLNAGTSRSGGAVTIGEWTHVLVTISSTQIATFYYNGTLSGTPADLVQTISTITTTNSPRIGNRSVTSDRTFDGSISKVKMWNKVLTTAEIALDYAGSPVNDGLILDVPLDSVDPAGNYTDNKGNAVTNSGSYLSIQDDTIAAAIKADRTTANDKYLMVGMPGGQVVSAVIEEAP